MINRRGLITGLISLTAAPAIVRASSLMPVKVIDKNIFTLDQYTELILKPMIDFHYHEFYDFYYHEFYKDVLYKEAQWQK